MLFLGVNCSTLAPALRLIKFGVIPLIQGGIIIALIVLLVIDIGKAVMAGKEDEIKSAQKLAIKRGIYAVVVFFVPWIVNVLFGVLDAAGNGNGVEADQAQSWLSCYSELKR